MKWTPRQAPQTLEQQLARLGRTVGALEPASSGSSSPAPEMAVEGPAGSSSSSPARAPSPARGPRSKKRAERKAKHVGEVRAAGAEKYGPRDIQRRVYESVPAVLEDATGLEARRTLARFPWRDRKALEHVARTPGDGRELDADLAHVWSRGVIAAAWCLRAMRRKSKRKGMRDVVDGYTQKMIGTLFRNRTRGRKPYSRSRLYASSYRKGSETCGWFRALRRVGWMWAAPRTSEANPRFIGPPRGEGAARRSFAFAVYWRTDKPPDP